MTEANDRIDQLLGKEEEVLKLALARTLAKVQAEPTSESLRNHEAAKKTWLEYQRKKQMLERPDEVVFKTVADAYRYAVEQGYRRTRQTMDTHIAAGKLARRPDGGITKPAVDAYLAALDGDGEHSPAAEMELRDQVAKTKKAEAQAEVWAVRAQLARGEVLPRSEVEGMLAERAQFLRQDLESFFRVMAPEIIALVEGDEGKVFELTAFGLDRLEEYLDRYARPMPMPPRPPAAVGEGTDQDKQPDPEPGPPGARAASNPKTRESDEQ